MHVFHIRSLSSILLFLLAMMGAVLLLLVLPAAFMMVVWNALVFEGFKGPEINLYQGFLLWGMVLVALKLILKPEIQLEFIKASGKDKKKDPSSRNPDGDATHETKATPPEKSETENK
ncbi:hypothetical protein [Vampirovibrio sp.]|uniref:hypothetical protein n=1 Tax=Vampirovibrio sp. TaxID=2717857 RepID=UPI003593E655